MHNRKRISVAAVVLALGLVLCQQAFASLGVGTTTPRIVIDQAVHPGGVYRLPPIPVLNTGTERVVIAVFPDRASKQTERVADPRWIRVTTPPTAVEPSSSALFDSVLTVPFNAAPGTYQVLVVGQPSVAAQGGAPNIQVGTKVVFKVVAANWLTALWWRLVSLLNLWAPWSYALLIALALLGLLWWVRSRYRFSFGVTRRT